MSRLKKSLALIGTAGMAVAMTATSAAADHHGIMPDTHSPGYWEMYWAEQGLDVTCDKMEYDDEVEEYTVELGDAIWQYVKAGKVYYQTDVDGDGYGMITTAKGISFVISCYGEDDPYEPPMS